MTDRLNLFTDAMEPPYRTIKTLWTAFAQIGILMTLCLISSLVPSLCVSCYPDPVSIIVYSYVAAWFAMFSINIYIYLQHYHIYISGYFEFSRQTLFIRHIPFIIFTIGAIIMMMIVQIFTQIDCIPSTKAHCGPLKPSYYLEALNFLESLVAAVWLVKYTYKVIHFNQAKNLPDTIEEDNVPSSAPYSRDVQDIGERGFSFCEKLLEKQADMVCSLKRRNEQLARHVLTLSTELSALKQGHIQDSFHESSNMSSSNTTQSFLGH